MDECTARAESASSVFKSITFYALSSTPEVGLKIGLAEVKCERFLFIHLWFELCRIL